MSDKYRFSMRRKEEKNEKMKEDIPYYQKVSNQH